jgi:hypothetical protein
VPNNMATHMNPFPQLPPGSNVIPNPFDPSQPQFY